MAATKTLSRVAAIERAFGQGSKETPLLVLPDLSPVHLVEDKNLILVNHLPIVRFRRLLDQNFQHLVHTGYTAPPETVPSYPLITVHSPLDLDGVNEGHPSPVTIEDFWSCIYALHHIFHAQEVVPVALAHSIHNRDALMAYALLTGLATRPRKNSFIASNSSSSTFPNSEVDVIIFSRGTFWQGAGTTSYHSRGFLQSQAQSHRPIITPTNATSSTSLSSSVSATKSDPESHSNVHAGQSLHCGYPPYPPYPYAPGFTRTPLSITAHPKRPPKPAPGEVIYRRWCRDVGMMLEMQAVDFGQEPSLGGSKREAGEKVALPPTPHLLAYNRWHNAPHVARAWHHEGSIEFHRQYLQRMYDDDPWLSGGPSTGSGGSQNSEANEKEEANSGGGTIGLVMLWDGEPMGWTEATWVKENHLGSHLPDYTAGPYDRGLHVLVGEKKFGGAAYSRGWFNSVLHILFLLDPRTERVIGEPNKGNEAIMTTSVAAGMHNHGFFDFAYKRSSITFIPRFRFFQQDLL